MGKLWTGDKSYVVVDPPVVGISDEALMPFAAWCRMNDWRFVGDPVLVRRVFDAYAGLPPLRKD